MRRLDLAMDSLDPDPIELARAESILRALEKRDAPPDEVARVWVRAGMAHQRCGNMGQARSAFEKAEKLRALGSGAQIHQSNGLTLHGRRREPARGSARQLAGQPHKARASVRSKAGLKGDLERSFHAAK
jgi:hypothetical protein